MSTNGQTNGEANGKQTFNVKVSSDALLLRTQAKPILTSCDLNDSEMQAGLASQYKASILSWPCMVILKANVLNDVSFYLTSLVCRNAQR